MEERNFEVEVNIRLCEEYHNMKSSRTIYY